MAVLVVPSTDEEPWPTLGEGVCEWIEWAMVYGPGPLSGQPYRITPEFRGQIYRMYEVFPHGHPRAGRRRFKRCALEERKGTAKTERAMMLVAAELHHDSPVRFDGWRREGKSWLPVGRPVQDPYIPILAYTLEQNEDLGYSVLQAILTSDNCPISADFDVSMERTLLLDRFGRKSGEAKPLATAPNSRDGARTTNQWFDETHRLYSPRHVEAHRNMLENAYKIKDSDPWSGEITTAGEPGQGSVAESTRAYAEAIDEGKVEDPSLFFFSRHAPLDMPMETRDDVGAFLLESSGPNAEWSGDIEALKGHWFDPNCDRPYYRRVWGNQWWKGGSQAFDVAAWAALARPEERLAAGELVVLSFDGSISRDSTVLAATVVSTGLHVPLGVWERPLGLAPDDEWTIPRDQVNATMKLAAETYDVWRLYADPFKWGPWLDSWGSLFGPKIVYSFDTTNVKRMCEACRNLDEAIRTGEITYSGDADMVARLSAHIAHARKKLQSVWDDEGRQYWTIAKDMPNSPRKIDGAITAVIGWEARGDALAAGAQRKKQRSRKVHAFF